MRSGPADSKQSEEAEDHAQIQGIMTSMLDRIATWQRAWGSPLRQLEE